MTTLQHHNIDVNGMHLHVVTAGRGEPVVLLHGWPQTWYEWRNLIEPLAEKFTLIAPDLPGLGDSSHTKHEYDKKTLALDIHTLIQLLGYERVRLVGHDWGGIIAYQ